MGPLAVEFPGPVQLNNAPEVPVCPNSATVGDEQVSMPPVACAVGAVVFWETCMEALAVQPFVAVTVAR